MDSSHIWFFLPILFVVAFLYASIGHGGASGYLAIMALFGFEPSVMKSSALVLNVFVSLVSFSQYYAAGHFRWKLFFPFIITSIPASFIGAYLTVESGIYKKVLGVLLLFSILRLLGISVKENSQNRELNFPAALLIGAIIGFFSGMIGIGGGIILSPIILLLNWANMKQTAAVSALFIFVNSIAGLAGVYVKGIDLDSNMMLWLFTAVLGGLAGAYAARTQFSNKVLQYILALVLLFASIKLVSI